jgi:hypothetical protein
MLVAYSCLLAGSCEQARWCGGMALSGVFRMGLAVRGLLSQSSLSSFPSLQMRCCS